MHAHCTPLLQFEFAANPHPNPNPNPGPHPSPNPTRDPRPKVVFAANVAEDDMRALLADRAQGAGNEAVEALRERAAKDGAQVVIVSAQVGRVRLTSASASGVDSRTSAQHFCIALLHITSAQRF
jgi:hypothetical protein